MLFRLQKFIVILLFVTSFHSAQAVDNCKGTGVGRDYGGANPHYPEGGLNEDGMTKAECDAAAAATKKIINSLYATDYADAYKKCPPPKYLAPTYASNKPCGPVTLVKCTSDPTFYSPPNHSYYLQYSFSWSCICCDPPPAGYPLYITDPNKYTAPQRNSVKGPLIIQTVITNPPIRSSSSSSSSSFSNHPVYNDSSIINYPPPYEPSTIYSPDSDSDSSNSPDSDSSASDASEGSASS
jgi:hypothetical protein